MVGISRKKFVFALVLIIALLGIPVMMSGAGSSETTASAEVTYTLDWEWGSASPLEDGQAGWQVVNDLGYVVQVEQAYLMSYSTQLVECEHEHPESETAFLETLVNSLMPKTAYAGHGGDDDSSLVHADFVESFAMPVEKRLGTVPIGLEITYCQAHYLIARADSQIMDMPQDVDMFGVSLYIAGHYQADGDAEMMPFTAQTSLANGVLEGFQVPYLERNDAMHVHLVTGNQSAIVIIRRQLGTLFDGVDFASMNADEIGRTVLWSLVHDTDIIVSSGETFATSAEGEQ